jgi:hypothetical protein
MPAAIYSTWAFLKDNNTRLDSVLPQSLVCATVWSYVLPFMQYTLGNLGLVFARAGDIANTMECYNQAARLVASVQHSVYTLC